jgi:single-strand DNA-binding protein
MDMVNKVILVGRLGADPEIRFTPDGTMVANLRLATDESYKSKDGEKVQKTEWHRIVTFRKLAEICQSYLSKGKQIYIEGRLQTRTWEDKDGIKRSTTEIIASNMRMLDGKGQGKSQDAWNEQPSPDIADHATDDDVPF